MTLVVIAAVLLAWVVLGVVVSLAVGGAFNAKDRYVELPRPRATRERAQEHSVRL